MYCYILVQGPANNGDRASQSQQGYNSPTAPRRGGQGISQKIIHYKPWIMNFSDYMTIF